MNIVWISDFSSAGSGYRSITTPLCEGLSKLGFDIRVLGLGYKGEEHTHSFQIIPAATIQRAFMMLSEIRKYRPVDAVVMVSDIVLGWRFRLDFSGRSFPLFMITPVEAPPLCKSWANFLKSLDGVFVISRFGVDECLKRGVDHVRYLPIGVDRSIWRRRTEEDRIRARNFFGWDRKEFIWLTVGYNQVRKNLWAGLKSFSEFLKSHPKSRYVMVTRVDSPYGWILEDLAEDFGIYRNVSFFESGLDVLTLRALYDAADVFVLPSMAEGLGLPLLEAMAVGVPCVGTNCTGISELLSNGRGYLVDVDYVFGDPFGNRNSYLVSIDDLVGKVEKVFNHDGVSEVIERGSKFVDSLRWEDAVNVVRDELLKVDAYGRG